MTGLNSARSKKGIKNLSYFHVNLEIIKTFEHLEAENEKKQKTGTV